MSGLGADVDAGVMAHPGGRRRSIGFHRVELRPTQQVTVPTSLGFMATRYDFTIPAVYALECHGCGVLFRVDSPHLLAHHQAHRRRSPLRRARAVISLAGHLARRAIRKD